MGQQNHTPKFLKISPETTGQTKSQVTSQLLEHQTVCNKDYTDTTSNIKNIIDNNEPCS